MRYFIEEAVNYGDNLSRAIAKLPSNVIPESLGARTQSDQKGSDLYFYREREKERDSLIDLNARKESMEYVAAEHAFDRRFAWFG